MDHDSNISKYAQVHVVGFRWGEMREREREIIEIPLSCDSSMKKIYNCCLNMGNSTLQQQSDLFKI